MSIVKVGVIGIGSMGKSHALHVAKGLVEEAMLVAVCGREHQLEWANHHLSEAVQFYKDEESFFNESGIDAVIIATPHYSHPDLVQKAFAQWVACSA